MVACEVLTTWRMVHGAERPRRGLFEGHLIHLTSFRGSLYTFWMDTSDGSMVLLSVVKDLC